MGEHTLTGTAQDRVAPNTNPLELDSLLELEKINPELQPLAVQAIWWLGWAHDAVISAQTEELREVGLSPSAFNMLVALWQAPDQTLEPCQLADRLLVSRPSVTGLLDTLQRRGLIERHPHGNDRRRLLVVLTAEGRTVLEAHAPEHYRIQAQLLGDLDPAEQAQLVGLLRRVKGATPSWLAEAEAGPEGV